MPAPISEPGWHHGGAASLDTYVSLSDGEQEIGQRPDILEHHKPTEEFR